MTNQRGAYLFGLTWLVVCLFVRCSVIRGGEQVNTSPLARHSSDPVYTGMWHNEHDSLHHHCQIAVECSGVVVVSLVQWIHSQGTTR